MKFNLKKCFGWTTLIAAFFGLTRRLWTDDSFLAGFLGILQYFPWTFGIINDLPYKTFISGNNTPPLQIVGILLGIIIFIYAIILLINIVVWLFELNKD